MIEYGDSVYVPAGISVSGGQAIQDHTGPLGRWVKRTDPDYDEAFAEQSELEASWNDAREETGDG